MTESAAKKPKAVAGSGTPKYPTCKLNTGAEMPALGFGTFLSAPGEVGRAVKTALLLGYKQIDCARVYGNEKEVGEAIKEVLDDESNNIKREDIFITSKLAPGEARPDEIQAALKRTLADLQLDYLDLYLIHQAFAVEDDPTYDGKHRINGKFRPLRSTGWGLQDLWRGMEGCQTAGLTRAIGVSNYPGLLLNDLMGYAKIPPAVLQSERHVFLQQPEILAFCTKNNIVFTGYAPLGAPGLYGKGKKGPLDDEKVQALAKKYGKTPAQILIRWAIDCKTVSIPKSVNPKRIAENFNVLDFALEDDERKDLSSLDRKGRLFMQDWAGVPAFV